MHPISFSGKPFKVLKQGSEIISVMISKSFPSSMLCGNSWEEGRSKRRETRKEGIALFQKPVMVARIRVVAVEMRLEHLDLLGIACGR